MKKPKLSKNGRYKQGKYTLINPKKYVGDPNDVIYRSSLELRYIKYFDSNPNVLKWGSEELQIPYILPHKDELGNVYNKQHTYFPDFFVQSKGKDGVIRKFVFEVKPKSQTIPPVSSKKTKRHLNEMTTYMVNKTKWHYAEKFCKKNNAQFAILTEEHIKNKW